MITEIYQHDRNVPFDEGLAQPQNREGLQSSWSPGRGSDGAEGKRGYVYE